MKSCSCCGLWKQDREFYPDRRKDAHGHARSANGRHHACIDCERENARQRMRRIYHERKAA
jgi:hypothetical protein